METPYEEFPSTNENRRTPSCSSKERRSTSKSKPEGSRHKAANDCPVVFSDSIQSSLPEGESFGYCDSRSSSKSSIKNSSTVQPVNVKTYNTEAREAPIRDHERFRDTSQNPYATLKKSRKSKEQHGSSDTSNLNRINSASSSASESSNSSNPKPTPKESTTNVKSLGD